MKAFTIGAAILLPLSLVSGAIITPVEANTFRGRNVGSTPNPTAHEIVQSGTLTPDYPRISESQSEEGSVGLRITLDTYGDVSGVLVERSSGYDRLDDAAMQYMKTQWRNPSKSPEGWPVASSSRRVDVTFRLK